MLISPTISLKNLSRPLQSSERPHNGFQTTASKESTDLMMPLLESTNTSEKKKSKLLSSLVLPTLVLENNSTKSVMIAQNTSRLSEMTLLESKTDSSAR